VPALTRINGVLVQLVEIPGLIAGAHEDRGGGRALLGVARAADALVVCHDAAAPIDELHTVLSELGAAGLTPSLVVATKSDEAPPGALERITTAVSDMPIVAVSVLDDRSLEALRDAIWDLVGLVRVFLRRGDTVEDEPRAYRPPVLVVDVADSIHHDLGARCVGAKVWGPSARFPGQRVGRQHELADGDTVEILG
jgi:ribosome-interacting GTPase 1